MNHRSLNLIAWGYGILSIIAVLFGQDNTPYLICMSLFLCASAIVRRMPEPTR